MIPDFKGPQPPTPDFSRSSFPYLRVAQFYEVPYVDVLLLAERLDKTAPVGSVVKPWIGPWRNATLRTWQAEKERRMKIWYGWLAEASSPD